LQELALGIGSRQFEGAVVGRSGLVGAPEAAQQLGARCVQVAVVVQVQGVDQRQRALDVAGFGNRCGVVQLDDR
jgi:hypothetical protein